MFFFTGYTWMNILGFFVLFFALMLLSEISRRNKWVAMVLYIALPIIFTIFVWPNTTGGNSGGTWFAWVKTYSALAGVWIFMGIRYNEKLSKNKFMLSLPMVILAINILEAVYADLEVYFAGTVIEAGLTKVGGPWNLINAIAGILLVLTLTGWFGIRVSKHKSRDMIWPDQLWFWVIAYDLWNMSYCYNVIPERSFYSGFTILMVSTLCEFIFRKGAWLQHRAQTLALFAMFSLTVDYSNLGGLFTITTTHAVAPKLLLSILSIGSCGAVAVYEIMTIRRTKRNPLKDELYTDLNAYQTVLTDNGLN